MFNEKKTFKTNDSDELNRKDELLNMFWINLLNLKQFDEKYEVLIKKGEDYKFKGLEDIMIYPLVSDEPRVCRINYSEFAKEALNEIDKYRIISNGNNVGDIYKKVEINFTLSERIKEEGNYILALEGEPKFNISISSIRKGYIFESVKISPFDKEEFLKYTPALLEEKDYRYCVDIEASILNKRNNILLKTYKQFLKHNIAQ